MGPLHLQQQLPLASPGPIICFEKCCQCPQMGPLHFQQLLPLALHGLLFLREMLPMSSDGPTASTATAATGLAWAHYLFLRSAANAPGWAHCIFSSCCHWLRLGPLFVLRSAADAPGWAHCICSSCIRQLCLG